MSGIILLAPGAPKKLRRRAQAAADTEPDWVENRQLAQWRPGLFSTQSEANQTAKWDFGATGLETGLFVAITAILSIGTALGIGFLTGSAGWGVLGILSVVPYFFLVFSGFVIKDKFKARGIVSTLTRAIDAHDVVAIPDELLRRWHQVAEAHDIDMKYADSALDQERLAFVDLVQWHTLVRMPGITEENSIELNKRIDARLEQIATKIATQAVATGQIVGSDSLNQHIRAITELPDTYLS